MQKFQLLLTPCKLFEYNSSGYFLVNTHPFDILVLEDGAKLIFTPCPGTKTANVEDSIAQLKQYGTSMLLTLMFDEEMAANNAAFIPEICDKHDITWIQLPIIDDEAPNKSFESQWNKYKQIILAEINNKGVVAVHCKGGTGRTGTVISLLLLALGWPVNKIIKGVRAIKPGALEIKVQLDYLNTQF